MGPFFSFVIFISVGTYLPTSAYVIKHHSKVVYIDTKCNLGDSFLVVSNVRLKLSSSDHVRPRTNCSLAVLTTQNHILIAKFRDYRMGSIYTNEFGNCLGQSIQLFDSEGKALLTVSDKVYCGSKRPISAYNLGHQGLFSFITYEKMDILVADMDLLITSVFIKESDIQSKCPFGNFDCKINNYCVNKDVICDDYDDCGNVRDEIEECDSSVSIALSLACWLLTVFICGLDTL